MAFAVGAPGYVDRVVTFRETAEGREFACRKMDPVDMPCNALAEMGLGAGEPGGVKPAPIERAYLRTRYPSMPGGSAGKAFRRAEEAFRRGALGDALDLYDESLEREPDHPLVLLMRMDALYHLTRYEEALAVGEHYVDLYPDVGFAHRVIADAADRLGRHDVAQRHLVAAMQLDPEFPSGYLSLIEVDEAYAEVPAHWLGPAEIWTDVRTGPAPQEVRRK